MNQRIAPHRVDWVERQLAAGDDFRAALQFLDARRARHVRGAHQTWGVALGLEVGVDTGSSPRTATIGPGLAYDSAGRELLLDRHTTVAIADEAHGSVVVAITDDGCGRALVRVAWGAQPLRLGCDVPLADVDLTTGTADPAQRLHVRTMAPPQVAGAMVSVGAAAAQGTTFEYTIAVDTSAAGFDWAPLYLVQPQLSGGAIGTPGVLGPLLELRDAEVDRFSLGVRFVAPSAAIASDAAQLTRPISTNPFAFSWVGVDQQRAAGVHTWSPPALAPVV